MAQTTVLSMEANQAKTPAMTPKPPGAGRHDRTRRLFAELAGIDLLCGNGERSSRRRRTGRDRALLQYAVLTARPAA
jgi:hypothetical protein